MAWRTPMRVLVNPLKTAEKSAPVYSVPLLGMVVVYSDTENAGREYYLLHQESGMSIIGMPLLEKEIGMIPALLQGVAWDLSWEAIAISNVHRGLVQHATWQLRLRRGEFGVPKKTRSRATYRELATLREKKLARLHGGEVVRGSGSNPHNPRDVQPAEHMLMEHKHLTGDTLRKHKDPYHTIDGRDMLLLWEQCCERSKAPVYVWEFGDRRVAGVVRDTLDEENCPLLALHYEQIEAPGNSWRLKLSTAKELERSTFAEFESEESAETRMKQVPEKILLLNICGVEWVLCGHWYMLRVLKAHIYA